MAILEKEVKVKIYPWNYKYFEDLGYDILRMPDKKGVNRLVNGVEIKVSIIHLLKNSTIKLTRICDNCGKVEHDRYYSSIYSQRIKTGGKDYCKSCSSKYFGNILKNNVKYENSAKFYCKKNNIEFLVNLYSSKNLKNMSDISHGSSDECIWNCEKHGDEHEHKMRMGMKTKNPNSCPYCSGHKVNNTNCLSTTHPHIAKILLHEKDGFKYTYGSGKRLDFKCPDCNNIIKNKKLNNIVNNGLSCPKCGDGISYPEKFVFNLLQQLKVDFEIQKKFDWSKGKKYDFYIPSIDCIIETHGRQHYEGIDGLSRGNTLEQEILNDKEKEEIALHNKINEYIIIDARMSESEYIKNNIINSRLSLVFDLKNIDWVSCHKYACSSLVLRVAKLFNQGLSSKEIEENLNLCKQTINTYLHKATEANLCQYDPIIFQRETALNASTKIMRPVVQLTLNNEFVKEYRSIRNASESLNIDHGTIGHVLSPKHRNKTGGGFKWMYKEDYEKYINEQQK